MLRALLLLAVFAATSLGCLSQRESHPAPERSLASRMVEGIVVTGPFTDADVVGILDSVRARTSKPIISIGPPRRTYDLYRRGEIEAVPVDLAEVAASEGVGDWIYVYSLSKLDGAWTVRDSTFYIT